MEILFRGFSGHAPFLDAAVIAFVGCAISIVSMLVIVIKGFAKSSGWVPFICILCSFVFVYVGFYLVADSRVPIVKATINETVPWQEVNSKYELLEQTGKIYTFKVKDVSIKDWETLIKEGE